MMPPAVQSLVQCLRRYIGEIVTGANALMMAAE
jgi:hypothetical protein